MVAMWIPPQNVLDTGNALQGGFAYVPGSLTSPSDPRVQREPGDGTKALAEWIKRRWSLTQAGTRRGSSMSSPAQRPDGTWRRRDLHEDGRGIDAMIGRDKAKGYEIANAVALFAERLGVQYIIFDGFEWSVSMRGPAWERMSTSADRAALGRAPDPHEDHVHIELTPDGARDGARMAETLRAMDAALASGTVSSIRPSAPTGTSTSMRKVLVILAVVVGLVLAVRALWLRYAR